MSALVSKTRLSRLHPYPGMIADSLAIELSLQYVKSGDKVLDPFCGTSRTLLAAAQQGAKGVGLDVNPLAVLVTNAKGANSNCRKLLDVRNFIGSATCYKDQEIYDLEAGRQVSWFSRKGRRELSFLIDRINELALSKSELSLIASVLSATTREVSYSRKGQWKIHRIPPKARSAHRTSAVNVFLQRLDAVCAELEIRGNLNGSCKGYLADSRGKLGLPRALQKDSIDLVITSPPYGDSKTTVQYGGISGLCIGVIRHLGNLDIAPYTTGEIDGKCLGGRLSEPMLLNKDRSTQFSEWWCGDVSGPGGRRVNAFLTDLSAVCTNIANFVKPGGRIIFVVARRRVDNIELFLDGYIQSHFISLGWVIEEIRQRRIQGKLTPYRIDSKARSAVKPNAHWGYVTTMRSEHILVFKRP